MKMMIAVFSMFFILASCSCFKKKSECSMKSEACCQKMCDKDGKKCEGKEGGTCPMKKDGAQVEAPAQAAPATDAPAVEAPAKTKKKK